MFGVSEHRILMVASDRLSAFDVVLPDPIPGKGEVLTDISRYWFDTLGSVVPNHCTGRPVAPLFDDPALGSLLEKRALVVRQLSPLPVEAVVRGYIIGSGWKDYQQSGGVSGVRLPAGLALADALPEPVFTPSTKAAPGQHDENIDFDQVVGRIGSDLAEQVRTTSIELYRRAAAIALQRGIIIADTKFEFGVDETGELFLIDEALTPDSSRFWDAESYQPGSSPASFDKQFVRDYLETLDWNKQPPGPDLPAEIIEATAERYRQARRLLLGPEDEGQGQNRSES